MANEKKAPFRANHVGSLLRPPELSQAREKHQKSEITAAQLGRSRIAASATRLRCRKTSACRASPTANFAALSGMPIF